MRWTRSVLVVVLTVALAGCVDSMTEGGDGGDNASARVTQLVAEADAAPTPQLNWGACGEPELDGYECAVAQVPLDYSRPAERTLPLAVVRRPAADPDHRIGTLFAGVGGPGGSGYDWARDTDILSGELARRFDVVTFDQRGIGRSSQVHCFADPAAQQQFWDDVALPPVNSDQQAAAAVAARELAAGCSEHSGDLLPHLTTVDAARDLDLLRRAMGEAQMNYIGYSYASYLGQVYGALFGDRVRALQLGSMVAPDLYTNDSAAALGQTAAGTEEVFTEFARLCELAAPGACAFAGEGVRHRAATLLDRLKQDPIVVGTGAEALPVSYRDVMLVHVALLYDSEQGWPALAQLLTELERGPQGDPNTAREVLSAVPYTNDFLESYTAISCADNAFPRDPERWPTFAATSPEYGAYWLYPLQACASWPAPPTGYPQRYTGPWTLHTQTPALLINNRFDPATPLSLAQRAEQALGNAHLLVIPGYGHDPTSPCVRAVQERYLIDLKLPDTGCPPAHVPFTD
ncbi:alpha/beta hydrolase [Nocardia cyriacigeorgica]|uniref:alpha/beta hydrolase n=1 Tax=Nocardia cyriacigeorgica TaxID=135487 RepID=UPI0028120AAF|nr:alpha/beta hydrolase [Nocardia cyriacigeorgica]